MRGLFGVLALLRGVVVASAAQTEGLHNRESLSESTKSVWHSMVDSVFVNCSVQRVKTVAMSDSHNMDTKAFYNIAG